jgi:hypothetical protein
MGPLLLADDHRGGFARDGQPPSCPVGFEVGIDQGVLAVGVLVQAVPAELADLGRAAAGVHEQLDRGPDVRPGGLFQYRERVDELAEHAGGQGTAWLAVSGLLRDVVAADGEVIGQPGHRLAGAGQPEGTALPHDHGELAAGRGAPPRGDVPAALKVFQPGEERDDVGPAQGARIIAVVAAVQPQAGRQLPGPPHVILQDGGGVVTPPGGQFLSDPHLDRLPEPVLGDAGEIDDTAAAMAQDSGVPDVLALLLFR